MKRYYVNYYDNFANTYNLVWTDDMHREPENMTGYDRISRKMAEKLAVKERSARKNDASFAYKADAHIFPIDYEPPYDGFSPCNDKRIVFNGYLVEYRQEV